MHGTNPYYQDHDVSQVSQVCLYTWTAASMFPPTVTAPYVMVVPDTTLVAHYGDTWLASLPARYPRDEK